MHAQFASPTSAFLVSTTDGRNHPGPAEPYRESASFGDLLQTSGIDGRFGEPYHRRPSLAETSLRRDELSRAEDRTPIPAKERALPEADRYDSEDAQEERRSGTMTEAGVEAAAANDDPVAAADMPSSMEAEETLAPIASSDAEDETCSARETETAVLSFSRYVPLNAASLAMASQSNTNGQAGVAPVPSGIATDATPTETISIANSSAQGMGHPAGEGTSGPPSLLIPQAVLEGGEGAGVNAAQQPAAATSLGAMGSDAFSAQRGAGGGQVTMQTDAPSPRSPTSLTHAPGDAGEALPIAVAPADISSDAEAGGEVSSAYEMAVLSFSLRVPSDAAKPTSASPSDTNGYAGAGPVATGPAAAPTPTESVSVESNWAQAKVHTTAEGVSSRPPSLLVPQAVLLDGGDGAGGNTAQTPAGATGPGATVPETMSAQLGHGTAQAMKPNDAPSPQSPASLTKVPGDAAQPSPIAVAAVPDADARGDDLAQDGQGFPAATAGHEVGTQASGTDGSLAARAVATQLAPHVGKAAKAGLTRIEIELEPASLGKVEVRLDFGRDGRISAMFVAETREALDALRTDARTLERALSEAGVKTDSASLDFGLREHGAGTGDRFPDRSAGSGRRAAIAGTGEAEAGTTLATEPPARASPGEGRLDIRA